MKLQIPQDLYKGIVHSILHVRKFSAVHVKTWNAPMQPRMSLPYLEANTKRKGKNNRKRQNDKHLRVDLAVTRYPTYRGRGSNLSDPPMQERVHLSYKVAPLIPA